MSGGREASPDGRHLLYGSDADLWALPLTGDPTPFPVVQGTFDEGQGRFSPDGRWVAYASDETGVQQIFVRPFRGAGGQLQVSVDGGIYPRWRHDGGEIFYVAPDGQLMAAEIEFPADGSLPIAAAPVELFRTTLATGAYILSTGSNARAQYDVARDGRFLMNNRVDDAAAPITIVLNWTTLLNP